MRTTTLAATLMLTALALSGCQVQEDTVRIGALMPLTGDAASLGTEAMNGAVLAVEEINAAGGIDGRQLELVQGDTQFPNTQEAVSALTTMIDADIQYIVGALASDSTDAVQQHAVDAGITLVSPASTAPDLTGPDHGTFFRVIANDTVQGPQAAQIVYEDLGVGSVVVMFEQTGYARGLRETFVETFAQIGGTLDGSPIAWENDPATFGSKAAEAAGRDPELVWISGQAPQIATLIKELRDQGYDGRIVTSEAIEDSSIFDTATTELEDVFFTKAAPDIQSQAYQDFQAAYEQRFGRTPGAFSPFAYDAVYVGAAAIGAVGDDGPAIAAWLEGNSVGGRVTTDTISFNDHGDVTTGGYTLWAIDPEAEAFEPASV